ncbi:hypothetical protein [Ethanoligenens sp.]|uniref:hypothetical protein n=1 Tax=Ethanoligenens sp. TaxID=2099655 RepID=UPI0039E9ABB3
MNRVEKGKLYDLRNDAMAHAAWSITEQKKHEELTGSGNTAEAEAQLRQSDQDYGYALAVADVLSALKCGGDKEIRRLLGQ